MTIKDHLRSLADKKPPASQESTLETGSEKPARAPAGLEGVKRSVVNILADEREGKGFIIDGEGKVATNFSLVNASRRIKVTNVSGDVFLGKIVRLDEARDLALIQIPARTPHHLSLGDPAAVDVGDSVFVVGKSAGAGSELTTAVVNGLRAVNGIALVQVDRLVDAANAGSPFLSEQGAVVGISTSRVKPQDESAGFAVSVKELKTFVSGQ